MSRNCICNVPGGSIVVAELDGAEVTCLKAQRLGRDYVHYYLVPLDPAPDLLTLKLVYCDPERVVTVIDGGIGIAPVDRAEAEVGQVFSNGSGHFLKVFDTAKTERYHAFVDLSSGEVRLRQERNISGVFIWRLELEPEPEEQDYMS